MGAEPYYYIVKYQADVNAALQELREREFRAGRYNPATPLLDFPIDINQPSPGAQHATISDAIRDAEADGTRSILDLHSISDISGFGLATRLSDESLIELSGTAKPTRSMAEEKDYFLDQADRGEGIYVILYKNNEPEDILFAGYSFD